MNNRRVHLCEECDALWDTPDEIQDLCAFVDFSQYMEQKGLSGSWEQVKILD